MGLWATKQPLTWKMDKGAVAVDRGGSTGQSGPPEGDVSLRVSCVLLSLGESDMAWEVSVTQGKWVQLLAWHGSQHPQ